jgi:NAD(P)-dependent dehydrogenase (short-subunit alcohol dehydrogenase family)
MRTVVVGGTTGIGLEIARHRAARGDEVVLTGRDAARATEAAASVAESARGIPLELAEPHGVADALADVGEVDRLVLSAIDRDANTVADYDIDEALRLVTIKLVGYTAVVHALRPRLGADAAVVVLGGRAKDKPYPGSTTVSTVNGGVVGLVSTLAVELAPVRVNAVHPGIVGDSPFWAGKPEAVLDGYRSKTPIGRLATMADVVHAVDFLLENGSVNAQQLYLDGGWLVST